MSARTKTESSDNFSNRHVGPTPADVDEMLARVGAASIDDLIEQTIPASIRLEEPLAYPPAETEHGYLERLREIGGRNTLCRTFIGQGYYCLLYTSDAADE